jgi:hypothetical protein
MEIIINKEIDGQNVEVEVVTSGYQVARIGEIGAIGRDIIILDTPDKIKKYGVERVKRKRVKKPVVFNNDYIKILKDLQNGIGYNYSKKFSISEICDGVCRPPERGVNAMIKRLINEGYIDLVKRKGREVLNYKCVITEKGVECLNGTTEA